VDEEGYRRYLRRKGKKEHVIDELLGGVRRYAAQLANRGVTLGDAADTDLAEYIAALGPLDKGGAKNELRAVALYYGYLGRQDLAQQASSVRGASVAATRRAFPLAALRGVDASLIARLHDLGIDNAAQMLAAGRTPADRERLAGQAEVATAAILELVKPSDLARLPGLKAVRARLYYDAGAETPAAIAAWEPEALLLALSEFVERTGFDGIAPLPKEVRSTVEAARKLAQVVKYEGA